MGRDPLELHHPHRPVVQGMEGTIPLQQQSLLQQPQVVAGRLQPAGQALNAMHNTTGAHHAGCNGCHIGTATADIQEAAA